MTDREIDDLISEIDQMARRIGCRFVPDPEKLLAFRCAKREEQAVHDHYRAVMKKLAAMPDPVREW